MFSWSEDLFKPCKGGLKSEGTGGFLNLKKKYATSLSWTISSFVDKISDNFYDSFVILSD